MHEQTTRHHQPNLERESDRQSKQAAMLEEALQQPGIREIMKVYEDWRTADSRQDAYRAAMKYPMSVITTNHTNM